MPLEGLVPRYIIFLGVEAGAQGRLTTIQRCQFWCPCNHRHGQPRAGIRLQERQRRILPDSLIKAGDMRGERIIYRWPDNYMIAAVNSHLRIPDTV